MARKRHDGRGWTLRRPSEAQVWYVRFTVSGRKVERSTGTRDERLADVEAARIVAAERAGAVTRARTPVRRGAAPPLATLLAEWLIWLEPSYATTTIKTWRDYARSHFLPFFGSAHALTSERCLAYQRARLKQVESETVRKEQTALRSVLAYCLEVGAIPEAVEVPKLPKRATGTPYAKRRRTTAPELSPAETLALIRRLPEWSTSRKVDRFPIRARFIVGYETGLRPTTLDRLSVPEHYRPGSAILRLSKASVKHRKAHDVPLTRRARRVLDYLLRALGSDVQPHTGLIFGWHNYREHLAQAAREALPPETAERFCGAHLRGAMITHELEQGKNILGIQHRVGHGLLSTTARYAKASMRAALATVGPRSVGVPHNSGGGK
jgi:site-specific recombinase XerD